MERLSTLSINKMTKFIYYLAKHPGLRIFISLFFFILIALLEGGGYWIGGVMGVLTFGWWMLTITGFIEATIKEVEKKR